MRSLRGPRIMTGRVYCIVSCWTASYDSTFSSLPAIASKRVHSCFPASAGFWGRKLLLYPRLECFFALLQTARCWGTKVSLSMRDNFPICPIDCKRERETIATLSIARKKLWSRFERLNDRGSNTYSGWLRSTNANYREIITLRWKKLFGQRANFRKGHDFIFCTL